ncbi:DUF302 domain-containing protein [Phanerochaete sordida]|uniref:DUF302 domain-containing protein n=1 Tax=Phanerochaete sordida TaxID=48140 RepID=A0A9P3GAU6_9APHY|nr:DUF302 domain-containing protein [Phanerochaete sordida]
MSVGKEVHSYTAQRVVLSSAKPFAATLAALDTAVNRAGPHVKDVLAGAKSKAAIDAGMAALTDSGARNFVFFSAEFHSQWLSTYTGEHLDEVMLYTFGNPIFAKGLMLKDPVTAIGVPPRIVILGTPAGGTRIQYDRPSSWFVENPSPELTAALQGLDGKIEELLTGALTV